MFKAITLFVKVSAMQIIRHACICIQYALKREEVNML